jgi:hypothetical protein
MIPLLPSALASCMLLTSMLTPLWASLHNIFAAVVVALSGYPTNCNSNNRTVLANMNILDVNAPTMARHVLIPLLNPSDSYRQ